MYVGVGVGRALVNLIVYFLRGGEVERVAMGCMSNFTWFGGKV